MKMDQGWWDGVLSLALPLTYFVNFVAALNLWGPQFTTLKGEDWTWFCDFLPLKPRVEKGKIVFGNKIMESAVKDTCLFFFLLTVAAHDSISVAIAINTWLKVVTSHWTAMEMRMLSQTTDSITTVLEFAKEVGRFFSPNASISQNTASWDWNAVVSGQFCLFWLQPLTSLLWRLPAGRFYHSVLSFSAHLLICPNGAQLCQSYVWAMSELCLLP